MDELMDQFAAEARELVQQASDDLLVLERVPGDRGRLESAFRAIHTLKGSVGLFDFGPMHEVLHQTEDLLGAARAGAIDVDAGLVDILVAVVDWVDRCVEGIARDGRLSMPLADQSKALHALLHKDTPSDAYAPILQTEALPDWTVGLLSDAGLAPGATMALVAIRYEPHPDCFFNGDDPFALLAQLPNIVHLRIAPRMPLPPPGEYDPFRCNLLIEALTDASHAEVDRIFRLLPDQVGIVDIPASRAVEIEAPVAPDSRPIEGLRTTMRVDTLRIDALVAIAGELITAKNGLLPLAADALKETGSDRLMHRIMASHQEIERLVGALYGAVTKVRMIPLEHTFRRFPRLVRETASRLGKSVDLVIEGDAVEADREIVEDLFEPLLHLVRNSLDHGIEVAADRVAVGKSARGTLHLCARQRGDQIEVELCDDGRGLIPDRIRGAAIARGLLTDVAARALPDAAALQLVFEPGFSTAAMVSDISGRGVGLDAVRSAVQRLGGRVELAGSPQVGASFTLHLPVTFSMSRLMVVEVGGERYGIPIDKVIEVLRIPARTVIAVRAGRAFVLRDRTIPLLYLADLLQVRASAAEGADLRVLVAGVGDERVGIVVDAIAERAETLMRPLAGLLRDIPGIAGTTMLGDGRVLLVLDLEELIG